MRGGVLFTATSIAECAHMRASRGKDSRSTHPQRPMEASTARSLILSPYQITLFSALCFTPAACTACYPGPRGPTRPQHRLAYVLAESSWCLGSQQCEDDGNLHGCIYNGQLPVHFTTGTISLCAPHPIAFPCTGRKNSIAQPLSALQPHLSPTLHDPNPSTELIHDQLIRHLH